MLNSKTLLIGGLAGIIIFGSIGIAAATDMDDYHRTMAQDEFNSGHPEQALKDINAGLADNPDDKVLKDLKVKTEKILQAKQTKAEKDRKEKAAKDVAAKAVQAEEAKRLAAQEERERPMRAAKALARVYCACQTTLSFYEQRKQHEYAVGEETGYVNKSELYQDGQIIVLIKEFQAAKFKDRAPAASVGCDGKMKMDTAYSCLHTAQEWKNGSLISE